MLDPGLRRTLSPAGRGVQRAAARAGVRAEALRPGLVTGLAAGRPDLDPTRFERVVLSAPAPSNLETADDLSVLGLPIHVDPSLRERLTAGAAAVATAREAVGPDRLAMRDDVRTSGMLGQAHVEAARDLARGAGKAVTDAVLAGADVDVATVSVVATGSLLDSISQAVSDDPPDRQAQGVGLVVRGPVLEAGAAAVQDPVRPIGVERLDVDSGGVLVIRTSPGLANVPVARLDVEPAARDISAMLARLPAGAVVRTPDGPVRDLAELPLLAGGDIRANAAGARVAVGRVGAVERSGIDPVIADPVVVAEPVVIGGVPTGGPIEGTATTPPLIMDPAVIGRFETAVALQRDTSVLAVDPPVAELVPYELGLAATVIRAHLDPAVAQPLRRDALISLGGSPVGALFVTGHAVDGWWATPEADRVMAYPTFPTAAYHYLAAYDRTRFCPGIDAVPSDSITLLETNPRFIASFMVGLNHEFNRELLWRGYPTDARGTPFRRFWSRLDGNNDIEPIHGWRTGSLAEQTTDPRGNLVLLLRGELLRRYPNTIVVAMRAVNDRQPSRAPDDLRRPVFAGQFDPDVSFFGFPLVDTELDDGPGWFFALMEPVTEPRFGLDETRGGPSGGGSGSAADRLAWEDTAVPPGGHLARPAFGALGLNPVTAAADDLAATLFQRPFALFVHAKHLLAPLPVQR